MQNDGDWDLGNAFFASPFFKALGYPYMSYIQCPVGLICVRRHSKIASKNLFTTIAVTAKAHQSQERLRRVRVLEVQNWGRRREAPFGASRGPRPSADGLAFPTKTKTF